MPDTKELICSSCGYKDEGHTVGADTCPVCGGSMSDFKDPYDFKTEYIGEFI